jgi:hypothetical protein
MAGRTARLSLPFARSRPRPPMALVFWPFRVQSVRPPDTRSIGVFHGRMIWKEEKEEVEENGGWVNWAGIFT